MFCYVVHCCCMSMGLRASFMTTPFATASLNVFPVNHHCQHRPIPTNIKVVVIMQFEVLGKLESHLGTNASAAVPTAPSTATKAPQGTPMDIGTPSAGGGGSPYASSPYNKPMDMSPQSVTANVDSAGHPLKKAPPSCIPFAALNPYKSSWTIKVLRACTPAGYNSRS